jgi:hypothetical protein
MKSLIALFLLSVTTFASAQDLCSRNKSTIRARLDDPQYRIAFRNRGGLIDGGVCWWHSRLQRAAVYLAKFEARAARPNARQVDSIIMGLRSMNRVVTIPGYSSFEAFTRDHEAAIQRHLEDWQKVDGFFNMQWLRGISGHYRLPAARMERQMREIFRVYNASPVPVWLMAQIKGITSHSFLLVRMEALPAGFALDLIDSNFPGKTLQVRYQFGDESLGHELFSYTFVPYTGFQEDFRRIGRTLVAHCPNKDLGSELLMVEDGAVELPREDRSE